MWPTASSTTWVPTVGQLADLVDALVAALGDDIGGAELDAQVGARPGGGP